jgi:hypothetical protein
MAGCLASLSVFSLDLLLDVPPKGGCAIADGTLAGAAVLLLVVPLLLLRRRAA